MTMNTGKDAKERYMSFLEENGLILDAFQCVDCTFRVQTKGI